MGRATTFNGSLASAPREGTGAEAGPCWPLDSRDLYVKCRCLYKPGYPLVRGTIDQWPFTSLRAALRETFVHLRAAGYSSRSTIVLCYTSYTLIAGVEVLPP